MVNGRRAGRVPRTGGPGPPAVVRRRVPTPQGGPERLVTLADGVFAIAITLLVLYLPVPQGLRSGEYREALRGLLPHLGAYGISLYVPAGFWRDHRTLFRTVRQVDGQVISLAVLGPGLAALLPFPTALISEYGEERTSVVIYAAAVAALGGVHLAPAVLLARRP